MNKVSLFFFAILACCSCATLPFKKEYSKMRRSLKEISYETGSDLDFPEFDSQSIDGWSEMTQIEQEQIMDVYS